MKFSKLVFLPAAAGLAACSSLTPVNDPVYLRIQDVEARLINIERVLDNESLIELAGEISSLRNETQLLLGEVETLRFQLEGQADGQRSNFLVLDERLSALEAAQERMRSMPIAAAGGAPVAALSDQQAYDAAFALIEQRNFAGAQAAFETFLASYPNSALRSNAQYWLAESHYAQLQFQRALAEFERVVSDYPQSAKVPDALLKIGFSNHELGNANAARQSLMQVLRQYPDTAVATEAEGRLARIAEEGG